MFPTFSRPCIALLAVLLFVPPLFSSDFTGFWLQDANDYFFVLELTQKGRDVTGAMISCDGVYANSTITGKVNGREIAFTRWTAGGGIPQEYKGYLFEKNGRKGIAGIFSFRGSWTNGWYAVRSDDLLASMAVIPREAGYSTDDISGRWELNMNGALWELEIVQDGQRLTLTLSAPDHKTVETTYGTISDREVTFTRHSGDDKIPQEFRGYRADHYGKAETIAGVFSRNNRWDYGWYARRIHDNESRR